MATTHAPATSSEATVIPPPGRPWTENDLLALDQDDYQYELVHYATCSHREFSYTPNRCK
jgi:hypothetical protein